MLRIDRRVGSIHLAAPLKATLGVGVSLVTLPFGDVAFTGVGVDGRSVRVGIEVKKVNDLIQSFTTGRLAGHQVPGMARSYERNWLVIEGPYRPGREGNLEVPIARGQWGNARTAITYRQLDTFLVSLEVLAGFRIRRTWHGDETVHVIADLYRWWQKEQHDSLHTYDESRTFTGLREPNYCERAAKELRGVSWTRAKDVSRRFKTAQAMARASFEDWCDIPGIGEVTARSAYNEIRGIRKGK